MTIRKSALALVAAAIFTLPAYAADKGAPASKNVFADAPVAEAKSWSGFYIGLDAGAAAMDMRAALTAPPPGIGPFVGTLVEMDGLSASGAVFGARVGGDYQIGKTNLVIGAFASLSKFNQAEWNFNIVPNTAGAINFRTALNQSWDVGARAGVIVNNSLIYGLVAYTRADVDGFSGTVAGTALGSLALPKFDGYKVGGGIETQVSGGWYLSAEYTYGHYDTQSVPIAPGAPINLEVEPTIHTASARLTYKFSVGK